MFINFVKQQYEAADTSSVQGSESGNSCESAGNVTDSMEEITPTTSNNDNNIEHSTAQKNSQIESLEASSEHIRKLGSESTNEEGESESPVTKKTNRFYKRNTRKGRLDDINVETFAATGATGCNSANNSTSIDRTSGNEPLWKENEIYEDNTHSDKFYSSVKGIHNGSLSVCDIQESTVGDEDVRVNKDKDKAQETVILVRNETGKKSVSSGRPTRLDLNTDMSDNAINSIQSSQDELKNRAEETVILFMTETGRRSNSSGRPTKLDLNTDMSDNAINSTHGLNSEGTKAEGKSKMGKGEVRSDKEKYTEINRWSDGIKRDKDKYIEINSLLNDPKVTTRTKEDLEESTFL